MLLCILGCWQQFKKPIMKRTLRNVILSLVVISSLFISCQSNEDNTKLTEKVVEEQKEKILNAEEQEIKAIIESF